ncbi:hypothetical protein DSECCO2_79880 [anaerobic digester metagenome]|mgnify:CR=1 FL=1
MAQYKINSESNSLLPICFKKAKLIERSTLVQIKTVPINVLQSKKVIVETPSKPSSRLFSIERLESELNEVL